MFNGTVPTEMRQIVAEAARAWDTGIDVAVGCSGNLTIERTLNGARSGQEQPENRFRLHSNDVNAYSCALGWYYAGETVPFRLKDESRELLDWIEPYLDDGVSTLAVLMQGTRFLQWVGRTGRYYERMVNAHRQQFDQLIEKTVQRLESATLSLASYTAADVRAWLDDVPHHYPVVMFPPFFCMEQDHRILTADLRWVPCGELVEGQQILTFEEEPQPENRMRRWTYGTVLRSQPAVKDCVRVHLDNEDSIVCTTDHPWLARQTYDGKGYNTRPTKWVDAADLIRPSKYPTRDGDQELRHEVFKLLDPWEAGTSFEDGWASGMFDGEGSITMPVGQGRGSSKLAIAQAFGPVADRLEEILRSRGFDVSVWEKSQKHTLNKPMKQLHVGGGFQEQLRALGMFRPDRLIDRLQHEMDIGQQSVRANNRESKPRVVAVEHVGPREIQSIMTSTGTYIGEGYMMHNSGDYTNMFAPIDEHFDWPEPEFEELDEAGKDQIIAKVADRPRWLLGLHQERPELREYLCAEVQTAQRGVPIYLYSSTGVRRLVKPNMQFQQVLMPKVGRNDDLANGEKLSLHPIRSTEQFNSLRSQFMARSINPGQPLTAVAVAVDGKIVGAYAWMQSKFEPTCAYLLSDFPVPWTAYRRLSKLIVMAAMSAESRALLQQSLPKQFREIATTAYSDNPKSAKYGRGTGLHLYKRTEGVDKTDGVHRYQLEYKGPFGERDLEGTFALWKKKHASDLREPPC